MVGAPDSPGRHSDSDKNQLLGQLDRSFPGLTLALPDVLGTKVGRLVAAEFADPACLPRWGEPVHPVRRDRGIADPPGRSPTGLVRRPGCLAHRDAAVARRVLAADLALLADLDAQIDRPPSQLADLLPKAHSPRCLRPGLGTDPGPTVRRSVTRPGGQATGSCTGRPGCPRCSTSRPATPRRAISREGSVELAAR